jgi:hypothetical protein
MRTQSLHRQSRPPLRTAAMRRLGAAATLLAAPAMLAAQPKPTQVVTGPIATYWLTADTSSGLGAMAGGGIGGMLGMLTGRSPSALRTLDLRLGSSQSPSGEPQAEHLIPPTLAMGASLPLLTPQPTKAPAEPVERTMPQGVEQPKGRMLIYWGCGEKVGPGQPIVLDFAKLGSVQAMQSMPQLASRSIRLPRGPSFGSNRSFGSWPNERDTQQVPAQASLRGEHQVKSNYAPDIRFAVERHDFMPAVEVNSVRSAGGTQQLTWKPVDGATGYFMTAFGADAGSAGGTDIVLWSSSAVQEMGGSLSDHLPPAEVARMIRERVVLPPDRSECTVPAEVMKAMPMGMLSFIAYGDELNLVHPPRPQDPKLPWAQQWAVKLRLKSTSMLPLGEGMGGLMGGGGNRDAGGSAGRTAPAAEGSNQGAQGAPAESAPPQAGRPPGPGGVPAEAVDQAVQEGVRVLRGLFGR